MGAWIWVLLGGLALVAFFRVTRWCADVDLDRRFRDLYLEARSVLSPHQLSAVTNEMLTYKELERIDILQGIAPKVAAKKSKEAAVQLLVIALSTRDVLP